MLENINMLQFDGVNCYVLRGSSGDALIDTGTEKYRDFIETWLKNYDISLIILTHGHAESVQNAAYFSEMYGAPIMISPYDMRLARDNSCRPYYVTTVQGMAMKKKIEMAAHTRMNRFSPKIFAEGGMDLRPYGFDGEIVNLEGHTKGSVGVLCKTPAGYDLYTGDAVMNIAGGPMPMTCESPKRAKETLRRIAAFEPYRILCGRGDPFVLTGKERVKLAGKVTAEAAV